MLFGGFDRFDEMPAATLATIAVDDAAAIGGFDIAMGHFGASSLAAHFAAGEMMTVLREPRTRLLSHYTFWRGWSADRHADWDPYDASRRAVASSWVEFLTDPAIASQTDNLVARMLLSPHRSIPPDGFIDPADDDELVEASWALLDSFGFADVVESGDALWTRLSDWLDAPIEPERTLVTTIPADTDWTSALTPAAASALTRRTSIDARLWSRLAARHTEHVDALREATFHRKLAAVAAATPHPPAAVPGAPSGTRLVERLRTRRQRG